MTAQEKRWLWRWPLFAIVVTAVFWGIWSIFAPVPIHPGIRLSDDHFWQLPLALSRWWDVPAAGVWGFLATCIVAGKKWENNGDDLLVASLIIGLASGVTIGLITAIGGSPIAGLGSVIIFIGAFWIDGLVFNDTPILTAHSTFILSAFLGTTLMVGPIVGLIVGLTTFLVKLTGAILIFGLWQLLIAPIGRWLKAG